jgi:hypothetical protein
VGRERRTKQQDACADIRAGMNHITLAENLGTSMKMLEDHYVKLSDDATGEIVEAHGFKLGLRPVKQAA